MKNPWTKSRHANPTEETETIKTETSLLLHEPMEMTWKKKKNYRRIQKNDYKNGQTISVFKKMQIEFKRVKTKGWI